MHNDTFIVADGHEPCSCAGAGSGGSILIKCRKLNMQNTSKISSIPGGRIRIDLGIDLDDFCGEEKKFKQTMYEKNIKPEPFWGSSKLK